MMQREEKEKDKAEIWGFKCLFFSNWIIGKLKADNFFIVCVK